MSVGLRYPSLAPDVYVAPSAVIAGDVDILDGVTIMHGSVLRGDLNNISIGAFSTVQENCVIHAAKNSATGLPASTTIGISVTVGAGSLLRSCKIDDMAVIGERSIVMEGSVVSEKAILLPGTVLPPAKFIPKGEIWGGNPATFVRKLTDDEKGEIGALSNSHEKWRELYVAEDLPYGGNWKEAERIDPAEGRLFPQEKNPPEWVVTHES
jgi:gamma-carbonic anhydrase